MPTQIHMWQHKDRHIHHIRTHSITLYTCTQRGNLSGSNGQIYKKKKKYNLVLIYGQTKRLEDKRTDAKKIIFLYQ